MTTYRGRLFTPVADPFAGEISESWRYFEDGHLTVENGVIVSVGDFDQSPEDAEIVDLGRSALISPGFVDTHLHAPQLEMIGSYGGHLLEWLNRYTFPTEMTFADPEHARTVAKALYRELIGNGTLTALLFSTIHTAATEIFFGEAENAGFRGITGKTMMDRHAPEPLLESPADAYESSRELIRKWHGKGLLRYAITPRFAPTSTPELLEAAGALKREFPDCYVHTHVSENVAEIAWVAELFPEAPHYASVYDRYGLLDRRSVLAHGVHLTDEEIALLRQREAGISHCPNSNLFLGSGLLPLDRLLEGGVRVALGTDIGAGTTPSLFNGMADAYKVQQVRGRVLSPFHLWYLATLGGARVLSLDQVTGSLESGKEADFIVIDLEATPLLAMRTARAESLEDLLAGIIFIGDDRIVERRFIRGREVKGATPAR